MAIASGHGFVRRHPVWVALVIILAGLLLALALVIANPQWLRGTLERAVSASLHRQVTIGELHMKWSRQPTLEAKNIEVANLDGGSEPRMARVGAVNMTVSPVDLLVGRLQDGRENWLFGGEEKKSNPKEKQGRLRLGTVSLAHGRIRLVDHSR